MVARARVRYPKRGEVYWVGFDPSVGAEIRKTRPALVIQNDIANRRSPITIVAALSSKVELPLYPTEVLVVAPQGGLLVDSVVLLNQVRSIDKRRLVQCSGRLKPGTMARVDRGLLISFGLTIV